MGSLLEYSVSGIDGGTGWGVDDQDFKILLIRLALAFDAEKHIALRKACMGSSLWSLLLLPGQASWEWYPYHYGL
jgi:hypothetical protein